MRTAIVLASLAALLAACWGASPEELAATVDALAGTQIAGTQTAWPTPFVPLPTLTTQPPTATPTREASATAPSTDTPLPIPETGPSAEPTAWIDPSDTAPLRFENNTGEEIFVSLSGPGYWEFTFTKSWNFTTQKGEYSYLVWIGTDGPYGGSFAITNSDKHTLVIDPGNVHVLLP